MSLSSRVVSCLVLLLLASACSAQTCGITSGGGHVYTFSGIGAVKVGINPASQLWAYTVCNTASQCTNSAWTACTGSTYNVPLALVSDTITWSFVDSTLPQLGVLARYPQVQDPVMSTLYRQLTVLFACGPDTVDPSSSGPGFAALESITQTVGSNSVVQYTFTVPTSIICNYIRNNIVQDGLIYVAGNASKAVNNSTDGTTILQTIISKLRKAISGNN